MPVFLNCEMLEARENPTGPVAVDPSGIPVASPPPSNVGSPTTPTDPSSQADATQQIIAQTLAGMGGTW